MSTSPTGDPPTAPASAPRCHALVPCAGVGARSGAGTPKQYVPIAGRAMVSWTLRALAAVAAIERIVVVLAPGDDRLAALLDADPLPAGSAARLALAGCGGATRAATVRAGLTELRRLGAAEHDWVLVHDAARCLVEPADIARLIDACRGDAVGGLLAMPIADTIKQADGDDRVQATIERAGKWAAQTPQMFRLGLLAQALDAAAQRPGAAVTDEAGAIESIGLAPCLVRGPLDNLKVTWPEDFALAERLLASRALNPSSVTERKLP